MFASTPQSPRRGVGAVTKLVGVRFRSRQKPENLAHSRQQDTTGKSLTLDDRDGAFTVQNDAIHLVASRATGRIEALRWQEQDLLISGPQLQIWRGPTDNDGIKGWTHETWRPLNKWRAQGLDKLVVKVVSAKAKRHQDGNITLLFEHLGSLRGF